MLVPNDLFLVTVPYGVRENRGWFRQFDRADVEELVSMLAPRRLDVTI